MIKFIIDEYKTNEKNNTKNYNPNPINSENGLLDAHVQWHCYYNLAAAYQIRFPWIVDIANGRIFWTEKKCICVVPNKSNVSYSNSRMLFIFQLNLTVNCVIDVACSTINVLTDFKTNLVFCVECFTTFL